MIQKNVWIEKKEIKSKHFDSPTYLYIMISKNNSIVP